MHESHPSTGTHLNWFEHSDRYSRRQRELEQYRLRKWELMTLSDHSTLYRILARLQERYDILHRAPQLLEPPLPSLAAAAEFYSGLIEREDGAVFKIPNGIDDLQVAATESRGEGEVAEISFLSQFVPLYPAYQEEFDEAENNRRVFARVWRLPHGKAKGTVIAIPGWYMADPRLSAIALLPGYFFAHGFNVVVYELPYTNRRMSNPKQLFPSSNLIRTNEGIFQAIFELRSIHQWLKANGESVVGCIGASFGGYLGALWGGLDELDFNIAVSPVVDLAETVESLFLKNTSDEALPAVRMALEKIFAQVSRGELRGALEVHSPLRRASKVAKDRQLVIAAEADEVVPAEQTQALASHWGFTAASSVSGGHFGQLCTVEAQALLKDFLAFK
jgi:hypothetical protein